MEIIAESILEGLEAGVLSLNFATSGLGVLVYILQALALYTIAQRREIKKPWMAWIPVLNLWILGSISDQYQYVVKRQVMNKRKVLLGVNIAIAALVVLMVIALVCMCVDLISIAFDVHDAVEPFSEEYMEILFSNLMYYAGNNMVWLILLSLLSIPLIVLVVIKTVYFYMALYDLYCSCEPNNSTLYLILSLVGNVVVSGAYALFMMLCKDKDLGMPPRKEKPQPEVVVEPALGYDPWSNETKAAPQRPTPVDPWDND